MSDNAQLTGLCDRFRGYYPVVIDVETAGFNAKTDALLEIAAITLKMDEQGWLMPDNTLHFHVEPFEGRICNRKPLPLTASIRTIHNVVQYANMMPCMPSLKWCVKALKIQAVTAPLWLRIMRPSITVF